LWVDGVARRVIQAPKLEPRIMRYELTDYEWAAIKPFLPNKPDQCEPLLACGEFLDPSSAGMSMNCVGAFSAFYSIFAISAGRLIATQQMASEFA
jgi:hypothetical protein